jgi:hypothetical protein
VSLGAQGVAGVASGGLATGLQQVGWGALNRGGAGALRSLSQPLLANGPLIHSSVLEGLYNLHFPSESIRGFGQGLFYQLDPRRLSQRLGVLDLIVDRGVEARQNAIITGVVNEGIARENFLNTVSQSARTFREGIANLDINTLVRALPNTLREASYSAARRGLAALEAMQQSAATSASAEQGVLQEGFVRQRVSDIEAQLRANTPPRQPGTLPPEHMRTRRPADVVMNDPSGPIRPAAPAPSRAQRLLDLDRARRLYRTAPLRPWSDADAVFMSRADIPSNLFEVHREIAEHSRGLAEAGFRGPGILNPRP